jgi:hypothetical protein
MLTVEEHLLLLERILIRALGEADADVIKGAAQDADAAGRRPLAAALRAIIEARADLTP